MKFSCTVGCAGVLSNLALLVSTSVVVSGNILGSVFKVLLEERCNLLLVGLCCLLGLLFVDCIGGSMPPPKKEHTVIQGIQ